MKKEMRKFLAMERKARDFIYLDPKRYTTLAVIKQFDFAAILLPLMMIGMGALVWTSDGISARALLPIVSAAVWSAVYWPLAILIRSDRVKRTFELRFLVNGFSGTLAVMITWALIASLYLQHDTSPFAWKLVLWLPLAHAVFASLYLALVVWGVHNGLYRNLRKKYHSLAFVAFRRFFDVLTPSSGLLGYHVYRITRGEGNGNVRVLMEEFMLIFCAFALALCYPNFLRYYYCKKYKITCDEYGNATSPKLERAEAARDEGTAETEETPRKKKK